MTRHTGTYTGDASTYRVGVMSQTKATSRVTILHRIAGEGSIPSGATVTVPTRRVVLDPTPSDTES